MINIPFDQYQRYFVVAQAISKWRSGNQKLKILEVGANSHKNIERFLEDDAVTYIDIEFAEHMEASNMIKGDATNMDFGDNEFDIIIALDVYEHIDRRKREDFLLELNRVSKYGFIMTAPFNYQNVIDAEDRVNLIYKNLYGSKYRWLNEHKKNGLPDLEDTLNMLEKSNVKYVNLFHGDINIWEKMMETYFFSLKNDNCKEYMDKIHEFYNNKLCENDFKKNPENTYRVITICGELSDIGDFSDEPNIEDFNVNFQEIYRMAENIFKILSHTGSYRFDRDEYIEVFLDGYNQKIEVDCDEIIGEKACERFIYLENKEIVSGLRIDPCNKRVILRVVDIIADMGDKLIKVDIQTNATTQFENIYFFENEDPQIQLIGLIGKSLKGVYIKFEYIKYDDFFCGINKRNQDYSIVFDLKQELKDKSDKVDGILKSINEISHRVIDINDNIKIESQNDKIISKLVSENRALKEKLNMIELEKSTNQYKLSNKENKIYEIEKRLAEKDETIKVFEIENHRNMKKDKLLEKTIQRNMTENIELKKRTELLKTEICNLLNSLNDKETQIEEIIQENKELKNQSLWSYFFKNRRGD